METERLWATKVQDLQQQVRDTQILHREEQRQNEASIEEERRRSDRYA